MRVNFGKTTRSTRKDLCKSDLSHSLRVIMAVTVALVQASPCLAVQVQAPAPATKSQVINGDHLSTQQINQTLKSGPRSFTIQTSTPVTGNLVIPKGVALINLISGGNSTALSLRGNLINSGGLLFRSDNAQNIAASFNANNILVNHGAIIASIGNLALNINALSRVVNHGTITGGGNLNITAGTSIANTGLIQSLTGSVTLTAGSAISNTAAAGANGTLTAIQAINDVNLKAPNIVNQASILSGIGNINISTASLNSALNNIRINASGGTFSALNGSIKIGDATGQHTGDINITGGDYYSKTVDILAGNNSINGKVNNITGTLNTQAKVEHFAASTPLLTLGTNCVNGDPTFVNGGDIVINGVSTFTQSVAILANGNITAAPGSQIVTNGANVTIVAGVRVLTQASTTTGIPTPGTAANSNVTIYLDPTVSRGGSIDFSAGQNPFIVTNNGLGDGGKVLLAALSSNGNGGNVFLGNNGINTSSMGPAKQHGAGGTVTIIAGATPTTNQATVTVGAITTGGGSAGHGAAVAIYTQQPDTTNPAHAITFNTIGNAVAGKIVNNGLVINTAGVTINGDINTAGDGGLQGAANGAVAGKITIQAGADIVTNNLFAFGAGGQGGSFSSKAGNGGNGAAISVSSENGGITINGTVNSAGGGGGGAGGGFFAPAPINYRGAGGLAGGLSIIAKNGPLSIAGGAYAVDGAAGGTLIGEGYPVTGGGGGSYGGGGGGGGGIAIGVGVNSGGGGGAGIFGGGGGGAGHGEGGNGGGSTSGGAGGISSNSLAAGQSGGSGIGGTGAAGTAYGPDPTIGGAQLGQGGLGAGALDPGGRYVFRAAYDQNRLRGLAVSTTKAELILSSSSQVTVGGKIAGGNVSIKAGGAGNLSLGGSVNAFGKASISSDNGNISLASGMIVDTPKLSLTSLAGAIGSVAIPFNLGSTSLAVATNLHSGSSSIYLTSQGNVTLERASTNGTFQLSAAGSISTLNSLISAPVVKLTGNDINVLINTADLSTSSTGSTAVSIKSTLVSGPVTINQASSAGNYTLKYDGDVIVNANVSGRDISITAGRLVMNNPVLATGRIGLKAAKDVTLNNNLTASTFIEIEAAGLNLNTPSLTLSAYGVILKTGGDIGSNTAPLLTKCSTLTANTTGNVFVQNTGDVRIYNSSTGPAPLNGSPITFSVATLQDAMGHGKIEIDSKITVATITGAGNGTIILNSQGGIIPDDTPGRVALKADNIVFIDSDPVNPGPGNGPIGELSLPINIYATSLSASTKNNVYIKNSGTANLNVQNSSADTFGLQSAGSIDGASGFGTITATTIILSSAKSIGTSATNPALLLADNITLKAGLSVFAKDSSSNPVDIVAGNLLGGSIGNSATNVFSLEVPNSSSLNVQASITSPIVSLKAGNFTNLFPINASKSISIEVTGSGNLNINQSLKAPEITLTAGSGMINQNAVGVISAAKSLTIVLNADGASANLQDARNEVSQFNDNVLGIGQIFFLQSKPMTLNKISGDKQNLTIDYTGTLSSTLNSIFTVNQLTLTPTNAVPRNAINTLAHFAVTGPAVLTASGGGDIQIGGILGAGNKNLTTSGAGGDIFIKGVLSGDQVSLTTNGGNIIQTRAAAPVNASTSLTINLNGGGSADLTKVANDISVFNDNVQGSGKVSIVSSKSVTLNNIIGMGQILSVNSAGDIQSNSPIQATTLLLSSSGSTGIGSQMVPVTTSASTLSINATAAGANAFASSTNASGLTLLASSANRILNVSSVDQITVAGAITGSQITFGSGGNGGVAVNDPVGNANTSSVTITAAGLGSIVTKSPADLISGQSITISSAGGSIFGNSRNSAMTVSGSTLSFNTSGNGIVSVDNVSTAGPVTLNNSASGLSFDFSSNGPLKINSLASNADVNGGLGSITLTAKSGTLIVAANAIISASGGNIRLQNNDLKAGSIYLDSGTQIKASSTVAGVGEVVINLGTHVDKAQGPIPPATVVQANETAPGKVYYGPNGITALAPLNTLNADGRDIIFDTDITAVGDITLGGGVTITADPPAGALTISPLASSVPRAVNQLAIKLPSVMPQGQNALLSAPASPKQADIPAAVSSGGAKYLSFVQNTFAGNTILIPAQTRSLQGSVTQTDTIFASQGTSIKELTECKSSERIMVFPSNIDMFAPEVDIILDTEDDV